MARHVTSTPLGPITGISGGGCVVWLGVRYATAARFEPPKSVPPWAPAMLDATTEAPSCPQAPNAESTATQSEDCLFLNIWLPATGTPNHTLAFIHGGGFSSGSIGRIYGQNFQYNGCSLAASRGVAVVTMQYRLGAFGWLARPNTNLGLRDQASALRFARRLLGPAAGRVLLFGQSAGSISACAHLYAPESRGLFDAAMLISSISCPIFPRQAAEAIADGFLVASPCARHGGWDAAADACLRNLSTAAMLEAQAQCTRSSLRSSLRVLAGKCAYLLPTWASRCTACRRGCHAAARD